jgi:hypothetical protein
VFEVNASPTLCLYISLRQYGGSEGIQSSPHSYGAIPTQWIYSSETPNAESEGRNSFRDVASSNVHNIRI